MEGLGPIQTRQSRRGGWRIEVGGWRIEFRRRGTGVCVAGGYVTRAINKTFHTNPKRKRGNALTPSLALRVWCSGKT